MNNYNMGDCGNRFTLRGDSRYPKAAGNYEYELNLEYSGTECDVLGENDSVGEEEFIAADSDDNEEFEGEEESVYDDDTIIEGEYSYENNETEYEDDNQCLDNDPAMDKYINAANKPIETHKQPTRANYIYKNKEVGRNDKISSSTIASKTKDQPPPRQTPSKQANLKQQITVDTEQINYDSGDGPFDHETYTNNLLQLLKISCESLNVPIKLNSSTQTNLAMDDASKEGSDTQYEETIISQEDNNTDNSNRDDGDDSSHMVSLSKDDFAELRNLQKTKRMICDLINKQIEKVSKARNLDTSVSQCLSMDERDTSTARINESFRKTRLESLNNLQSQINELITLENID